MNNLYVCSDQIFYPYTNYNKQIDNLTDQYCSFTCPGEIERPSGQQSTSLQKKKYCSSFV